MDNIEFQDHKLSLMTDGRERELALMVWRAQAEKRRAEEALEEYYLPLVHACSSKQELNELLERMPITIGKSFVVDYRDYVRDWSMSHDESEAKRKNK